MYLSFILKKIKKKTKKTSYYPHACLALVFGIEVWLVLEEEEESFETIEPR